MSGISFTRITSSTTLTKHFRLRGNALEKVRGGEMSRGTAERMTIDTLPDLIPIIAGLSPRQGLAYGTLTVPGDKHQIVTKARQKDGINISRSRKFFEFREDQPGILLLDYDPADGEQPLSAADFRAALISVCPILAHTEMLVSASASSFVYRINDGECMKGAGGWHMLVRVANAAEILALGETLYARLWLAGLGRITKDGKARTLIDKSVWQPERLSYEGGCSVGSGLEQRRPPVEHFPGEPLRLSDIALTDGKKLEAKQAQDKARGITPRTSMPTAKSKTDPRTSGRASPPAQAPAEALTPSMRARVMRALLHVPADIEYSDWIKIGMGLKTSFGDEAFSLWDNWSKMGATYPGNNALRAKWTTFDGYDVTVRTIFHYARSYGWSPARKKIDVPLPVEPLPEPAHEPLAEAVSVHRARSMTHDKMYDLLINSRRVGDISAFQITVGVGKTTILKQMFEYTKRNGLVISVVAKDKQQCAAYEQAGGFWRHGRENVAGGFSAETPWHCAKVGPDGPIVRLTLREHRLAAMCKSGHCENGNKMMLEKAHERGVEPGENIIRFFKEQPDMLAVHPCMWFDHNDESKRHAVRVMTSAGLSPSDLVKADGTDIDALCVDEAAQWSHSQMLGVPEIRVYLESLQELLKKRPETEEALAVPVAVFQDLARKLGEQAATGAKGAYCPINFDIKDIANQLKKSLDEEGMAPWEKPRWEKWLDLVRTPLRALTAIRDGIKAGSLSIVDGQLHVTYLHPVLSVAMKKKIPILIMDATLDQTARGFVPGERVHRIVAEPNLAWKIDPRWFKSARSDDEYLDKESAQVFALRNKQQSVTGRKSFIIARKTLAMHMLQLVTQLDDDELWNMNHDELWELSIEHRIGWWGWHEAAHDEWNGCNGILWGQIPTPDEIRLQNYMDHRAALLQIKCDGAKALPLANNEWADGAMVRTGDCLQQSKGRLPIQPEVRDWLLSTISGEKIQAAGRARATGKDYVTQIWQVGGLPPMGLSEHGIRPVYERLVDGLSREEVAALQSAKRHDLITEAAALVIASGSSISRDRVREFATTICKSMINIESSEQDSVRRSNIYIYLHRTELEALDDKENNELDDVLFTESSVWDHEYTSWRKTAPAGMSRYFAYGAEKSDNEVAEVREVQNPELAKTAYNEMYETAEPDVQEIAVAVNCEMYETPEPEVLEMAEVAYNDTPETPALAVVDFPDGDDDADEDEGYVPGADCDADEKPLPVASVARHADPVCAMLLDDMAEWNPGGCDERAWLRSQLMLEPDYNTVNAMSILKLMKEMNHGNAN